jgi:hypothetical protein
MRSKVRSGLAFFNLTYLFVMFKKEKDLEERSKVLLKNKEVRSLRSTILSSFPNVSEEEVHDRDYF